MRKNLILAAVAALSITSLTAASCTTQQKEQAACAADALIVPAAEAGADAASIINPGIAAANTAAQAADAPVHKQVQADCNALLSAPAAAPSTN